MAKSKAIMINKIEVKVLFEVLCPLILKLYMAEKKQPEMAGTKIFFSYEYSIYFVFLLSSPEPTIFPRLPGVRKRRHGRKSCVRRKWLLHMAKRKTEHIRQKGPMASERAKAQNGVEELLL